MKLLLDFIGEPDSKFNFKNDEHKGFSCLKEPLPFCLNPAKGNSRKEDVYDLYKAKGSTDDFSRMKVLTRVVYGF